MALKLCPPAGAPDDPVDVCAVVHLLVSAYDALDYADRANPAVLKAEQKIREAVEMLQGFE